MEKQFVVGVDVGGQTTKLGVVDARGIVLAQTVIRSDVFGSDAAAFITALADAIKNIIREAGKEGQIRGIGVGAPNGNHYTGSIEFAPNLAWAANTAVPLSSMLQEKTGIPVSVTNDANAAAVGEMTYGIARGMKNFIMITLGTGVGSGIIINGELVYGHDGFAGELGHVTAIRHNGRVCGCGKQGCLEAYCSAIGVAKTARDWLEMSSVDSVLRNVDNITSKDVYDAAKVGDSLAKRVLEYTGDLLGRTFADFVAFSAPEAIVLFGGLARAKEFLYEPIMKSMNDNLLQIWKGKVKILFSELKASDAAILGASSLAWEL